VRDYTRNDTSHLGDIQRTGDTSLVSRGAGVALPARVLQAGSSDETWSVWMRETSPDNAKQEIRGHAAYRLRGVAYNGSHRRLGRGLGDYLYGSRGRMRMSVYKEMGAAYLTRTKDLTLVGVPPAGRVRGEVVSPRQRSLMMYA
jgi:hypothetical protein